MRKRDRCVAKHAVQSHSKSFCLCIRQLQSENLNEFSSPRGPVQSGKGEQL